MQGVVQGPGTGKATNFGGGKFDIAGKTGTTTKYVDVWFAGYTNYYTATAWAGFDNNVNLTSSPEKNLAKTMWKKAMEKIHEDLPESHFKQPAGIVTQTVCASSGLLQNEGCPGTTEIFDADNVPMEHCDVHYVGEICDIEACFTRIGDPKSREMADARYGGAFRQSCLLEQARLLDTFLHPRSAVLSPCARSVALSAHYRPTRGRNQPRLQRVLGISPLQATGERVPQPGVRRVDATQRHHGDSLRALGKARYL